MASIPVGLLLGAVALGAVHGIEPGHGWPVAASYALDRRNQWAYGLAASLLIGVGHLVSSVAVVAAFFYAKAYFDLAQVNEPMVITPGVRIGGPVSVVAGVLLIALGIREYRHGHSHGHSHGRSHDGNAADHARDHEHADDNVHGHTDDHHGDGNPHADQHHEHDHSHTDTDHGQGYGHEHGDANGRGPGDANEYDPGYTHDKRGEPRGWLARLKRALPTMDRGTHDHGDLDGAADRGLLGIAWFAFLLGFAHEEEFEIIALCAGSTYCLELVTAYAFTVIAGIVGLTLLLIAGYRRFEERVERYTPYLPAFSAAVLGVMGVGFVTGVF